MKLLTLFLILSACIILVHPCQHAGGPVKQSTIINYLKNLIKPYIPYNIPSIEIHIATGFSFNATNVVLRTIDFASADMALTQPNTVQFSLLGLLGSISLDWTLNTGDTGTAQLAVSNCKGSTTAFIAPDHFKNTNATFFIGELTFQSSNQPVIEPYWDLLKPILIDTLQREIPNLIVELNTEEIKTLVYPIVRSIEPVHIPDLNTSVLGVFGGFSNMSLTNIDFTSATLARGANDNEIVFELTELTALITNNWELKALGFDDKGDGHILINQTTVSITVGIGEDAQAQFTVNLDTSKIDIGGLVIKVDSGDSFVLNWLISEIQPLLVITIESTFQAVVCLLFDGIPD